MYSNKELKIIDDAKKICMERDANRCRHCGSSDALCVKNLIDRPNMNNWNLSNLITLCEKCYEETKFVAVPNRVGVILAGGKGTRLFPMTKLINKHELPIGLIPMIFYPIKTLRSFGISKVLIILDRENSGSMIRLLGSGKEFGMEFSYRIQEGSGGIADALYLTKGFVGPNDEIFCILGDNIFDTDEIYKSFSMSPEIKACVFLKKVSNPQDYGVAIIDGGRVVSIVEKPRSFLSDLAVVGLYVYKYDVFDVIETVEPSKRGELEISSVNDYYASKGELNFTTINGYWADCGGSIQRYCEASLHGAKKANVSEKEISDFVSIIFDRR